MRSISVACLGGSVSSMSTVSWAKVASAGAKPDPHQPPAESANPVPVTRSWAATAAGASGDASRASAVPQSPPPSPVPTQASPPAWCVTNAQATTDYPGTTLPSTDGCIHKMQEYTALICGSGFCNGKLPLWVAEALTAETLKGHVERGNFQPDEEVLESIRAEDSDYTYSGWSRGHLAMSSLHQGSSDINQETYLLSDNIVPQDSSMNGLNWLQLEDKIKLFAEEAFEANPTGVLYVLSGPVFLGKTGVNIGDHRVPVPDQLFKIVKYCDTAACGRSKSAAFLMDNKPQREWLPISKYQVRIDTIQDSTRLNLVGMRSDSDLCADQRFNCAKALRQSRLSYKWAAYGAVQLAKSQEQLENALKYIFDWWSSHDFINFCGITRKTMKTIKVNNKRLTETELFRNDKQSRKQQLTDLLSKCQ